jgi:hypothetical protein
MTQPQLLGFGFGEMPPSYVCRARRMDKQGSVAALAILLDHRQAREIAKTQRPCSIVQKHYFRGQLPFI